MSLTSETLSGLLQEAIADHRAGQLDKARTLYKKVIESDPCNADALNLLGILAQSSNELDQARGFFERAIACNPGMPDLYFNLGNLLTLKADTKSALAAYERAIALKSDFVSAHLNKGALLDKAGHREEAIGCFRTVISIAPDDPRGHLNLGLTLLRLSRPIDAEVSLTRAIELDTSYLEAHLALASIYSASDRVHEAIYHTRQAIGLKSIPEYHSNLGELLRRVNDQEAALAAHRVAFIAKPDNAIIMHNYGAALYAAGQLDEAQKVFRDAISQAPQFIEAYVGLAKVYEHQGLFDLAIATLQRAVAIAPQLADLLFKLSVLQLLTGNLLEGWRSYESRFSTTDKVQSKHSPPPPYWVGQSLSNKTILVWVEQGLGDEILYSSMIPEVLSLTAHCVFECTSRMAPIFVRSFPQATVVSSGSLQRSHSSASAPIDFQIAIASLGQFLRTDFKSFPSRQGFLKANPARASFLRTRYRAIAPNKLVVGVAWRSNNKDIGVIKSSDLAAWGRVLKVPGITFINLQYGDCADELIKVKGTLGVDIFHDPEINPLQNMDDFFAQVDAVDLVISTSNTAIHVAGSLGIRAWLLLSGRPGGLWYWFLGRNDSPWYPTVRLYRSQIQGLGPYQTDSEWDGVISQVEFDLQSLVEE